ncbi:hypothetical protein Tco_0326647 [Tanacetum coccineum]
MILNERIFGNLRSSIENKPRVNDETIATSAKINVSSIRRIYASQYADKLTEVDGIKDLEAYYPDATPLAKALPKKEKGPGSFTLPCSIYKMCFNNALVDLGASISVMPYATYAKLDIPEDSKTPLILGRPFLSTAHAIINVIKAKITLRVGNSNLVFKSNKRTSNVIRRVYAIRLLERTKVDLETRQMDEPLMINRSQDPNFEDFLELNDLNEPLEPSDDDEFSDELVEGVDDNFDLSEEINTRDEIEANKDRLYYNKHEDYPSFDNVKYKIHIDHPYNLKFSKKIGIDDDILGEPFCSKVDIIAGRFEGKIIIHYEKVLDWIEHAHMHEMN